MRATAAVLATLLLVTGAPAAPKPEAVLRKELGNDALKKRDFAKARDQYLAALKLEPSYEDVHYNLGVVYFARLHDYPRALYHLVTYSRLAKDAPDMDQVQSFVFQSLEKIEEADRSTYTRAVAEGTAAALRDYLVRRPDSVYAADAKDKLRQLAAYDEGVKASPRPAGDGQTGATPSLPEKPAEKTPEN